MNTKKYSRIPIDLITTDMIIAEDVVDYRGIVLVPKNTVITNKHIFKLKLYEILSIVIYDKDGLYRERITHTKLIEDEPKVLISPEFENFSERYIEQQEEVQAQLKFISNGESIKSKALYKLSSGISSILKNQSSLFNYLYHLHTDDNYTYSHSINVSLLCNIFGKWLKMNEKDLEDLTIAGLLHDIGKLKIAPEILNKPGKLTEEEFKIIKNHTVLGYEIVHKQPISKNIKMAVLMHHEKIDGSGYPLNLKDTAINDFGKIVGICDIYDAMTSARSYHKKFSPFKVIQMFEEDSYGLLDTKFLYVFLENIAHNYIGSDVQLSDERTGKIVFINSLHPSKPMVQINNDIIDLSNEKKLLITDIL